MENATESATETGEESKEPAVNSRQRRRQRQSKRAPQLPLYERRNWLIHLTYVRKDFSTCEKIIREQLDESHQTCEYAFYVHGLIARQQGKMQLSLELFKEAMRQNPHNIHHAKQVARSYFLMGRHRAALDVYDQTVQLGLRDWHVVHNQGVCYLYLKDLAKAKSHLREALKIKKHDSTYLQLSKVCMLENDLESAKTTLLEAIKFSPENTELLTTLGLLHLQMNNSRKAFELLGTALTYDQKNTKAILASGSVIQNCEDYDVALVKYRISAVKTPESAEMWTNIGMCFFGKKKYVAAIACLKHATYLAPFEWIIRFDLGLAHLQTKQYASAFHYLSAAVHLNPHFSHSYMLLGVTLNYLGDYQNSAAAFEKALSMDSNDPLTLVNYAALALNEGNRPLAAQRLALVEKLIANPDLKVESEVKMHVQNLAASIHMGK